MLNIYFEHLKHRLLRGPWLWGGLALAAGLIWGGVVWLRPAPPRVEPPEVLPADVTLVENRWYPIYGPDCPYDVRSYGCAMAAEGEWLAVGARHTNAGSNQLQGLVCLYRGESGLPEQPVDWDRWTLFGPEDAWAGMEFGHRLAMFPGILLVTAGSSQHDENPDAVYVVEWQDKQQKWKDTARLTCPPGMAGHGVGLVVLDKDTIAIGAPDGWGLTKADGRPPRPVVCIYQRTSDPADPWRRVAEPLRPPPGDGPNQFGFALATDGKGRLIVGAPGRQWPGDNANDGAVYIYRRSLTESPEEWALETRITGTGNESMGFGAALAYGRDRLAVGHSGEGPLGKLKRKLCVYQRMESGETVTWKEEAVLSNERLPEESLGSIAISGDGQWIAGSAQYDGSRGPNTGAVFVWRRTDGGPSPWVFYGRLMAKQVMPQAHFGVPLVFAGRELLMGSSVKNEEGDWEGTVFRWRVPGNP